MQCHSCPHMAQCQPCQLNARAYRHQESVQHLIIAPSVLGRHMSQSPCPNDYQCATAALEADRMATCSTLTLCTFSEIPWECVSDMCTKSKQKGLPAGTPATSMAVSREMLSVMPKSVFLKMKPMIVSARVMKPCSLLVDFAFAIIYAARITCTKSGHFSDVVAQQC